MINAKRENNSGKFIFILMPFEDKLTQIYERYIKTPLESEGHSVKRADDMIDLVIILK